MPKTKNKKINYQSGQAMLISVIFFLFISISIIAGLVGPTVREFNIANDSLRSRQSFFLSESAMEDAYYRINKNKSIGSTDVLTLNGSTGTATITSPSSSNKTISSLGDVSLRQRLNELKINSASTVVFKYGTQAGQGGIIFLNNAYLNGTLYSNGNVTGANGAYITGSAFVAGSSGTISTMSCVGGTASGSNCTSATPGNAYAHTITSSKSPGTLYCQTGSGNNKSCDTSQADPAVEPLPVTDANITAWKSDAAAGTIINGNYTVSTNQTLGPTKIIGNLTITGTPTLTLANTVWVTGNILFQGNSGTVIKLASSYAGQSGIMIADGYITIGNNTTFQDSGTTGSYIMLLSTSTCDESITASPCNSNNAIAVNNNASIVITNAQNGTISFANNATVKELVGKTIRLKQNVGINYGSGSITVGFTSGSGGVWSVSSWQEK